MDVVSDRVSRQGRLIAELQIVMQGLRACHCCGLIHRAPPLAAGETAACVRCGAVIDRADRDRASARTAAAALGALVLFFPAVLLPILQIQQLGHRHESSILTGTIDLLAHGNWFVGLVVLLFSIVFPLLRLVLLNGTLVTTPPSRMLSVPETIPPVPLLTWPTLIWPFELSRREPGPTTSA